MAFETEFLSLYKELRELEAATAACSSADWSTKNADVRSLRRRIKAIEEFYGFSNGS